MILEDLKNYCMTFCIIFWKSEYGIFFLASIRVTASLSTAYLNSGFSLKIAWTMVFASEQEIPRPNNKRRRKSYYSGK